MRLGRSFLVLFGICVLGILTLGACSSKTPQQGRFVTLKIYHTNDIHAHLRPDAQGRGGLAYLATALKTLRSSDADALIVDAGDFYKKGSLPAQHSKDEVTAQVMSLMPYYDARALGNNEVKVGIPRILDWSKSKEHEPLLSANVVDKNGETLFQPYVILEKSGLKIGLIGLTPPLPIEGDVQGDLTHDSRAPYKAIPTEEAALPYIAKLRPQVDVLVLLSHQNYKDNVALAKKHPEVDLIVSGHSHILTPDQKSTGENLVVETGEFAHNLGFVNVVYDSEKKRIVSLESSFLPVGTSSQTADKKVQAAIDEGYKKWAPDAEIAVGEASAEFNIVNYKNPFEGSLDDWAADTLCEKADCDVGIVNREMLRESLGPGTVTKEEVYLSAPYDDNLVLISMSREKFLSMMTGALKTVYKKFSLIGFTLARGHIEGALSENGNSLENAKITLASPKKILKVALPGYVFKHCAEFFEKQFCPMPESATVGGIRNILEEKITHEKTISPPPQNRVIIEHASDRAPSSY